MPIANCFARAELLSRRSVDGLLETWSDEAGVGREHMTVNLLDIGRHLELAAEDVHVITTIVDSGHVVEDREVQEW